MHYYQFNIGDYASHTSRLTIHEDIAYRRLLDLYYLNERPLNGCSTDVAREIGMLDLLADVEYILSKFFEKDGELWRNKRCDIDIKAYQGKRKSASKAGKASAEARRGKAKEQTLNDRSTDVQPTINQEPLTSKQETVKDKRMAKRGARLSVEALPDEWETFCREERQDLHPHSVFSRFRDHWIAQPGQKGVKLDWLATWRNWVRNERQAPGSKAKRNDFNSMNYGEAGDL